MKKILSFLLLLAILCPAFTHAQNLAANCGQTSSNGGQVSQNSGQVSSNSGPSSGGIQNPLKGVPNIACLFYRIVDFIMSLSYIVIAVFLLWSGFKFVTAQGSEDKLTDAKKTFWYTIIGALILIGANTIIKVVQGIISGIQG